MQIQIINLDDKDFNFDWRETPLKDHPDGYNCKCPKHLEIKENIMMNQGHLKVKLCPDHYRIYFNEIFPKFSFWLKLAAKFAMFIGIIRIKQIPAMQSADCFYCRFGSGGREEKPELPPIC